MRGLADSGKIRRFLAALAREAHDETAIYLTGGATAVQVSFYHYDPYSQVLAKIERGHDKDLADVAEMLGRGLVRPERLRELFESIRHGLHRYPAVDPASFEKRLDEALRPRS